MCDCRYINNWVDWLVIENCRLVTLVYVEAPYQQGGLAGHVLLPAGKAGHVCNAMQCPRKH